MSGRVIITGASGGLGQALSEEFARNGFSVGIGYFRNEEKARAIYYRIKTEYPRTNPLLLQVDVSSPSRVEDCSRTVRSKWGEIDLLINNAGININKNLFHTSFEQWERIVRVNLYGVFYVTRSFLPLITEGGAVLSIGSLGSLTGASGQIAYVASKSALAGFTKSLARELSFRRIRVNLILPGYMDTSMFSQVPDKIRAKLVDRTLLRRVNKVEEVSRCIYFIARFFNITGEVINLDSRVWNGGLWA